MSTHIVSFHGQTIGRVDNEPDGGIFRRDVKRSKHLLRSKNAWCLANETLSDFVAGGVAQIELTDKETTITYTTTPANFLAYGEHVHFGAWGEQTALPLRYWTTSTGGQNPGGAAPAEETPKQGDFFGLLGRVRNVPD